MREERDRLKAHVNAQEARTKAFSLELQKFVERSLRRFVEERNLGQLSADEAARVLNSLFEELKNLGLEDKIAQIRRLYSNEIAQVEQVFARAGAVSDRSIFTDIDRNTINAIANAQEQQVLMATGATVTEVQSALMRTAIAGEPLDVGGLLEGRLDSMSSRIETIANTGLAGFQRTITLSKAKDLGFELMIYLGPDDSITRPFCEKLLNKNPPIYTLSEINAMKNGQGLPVATYGGGYNCRHQWRPISKEKAESMGYSA